MRYSVMIVMVVMALLACTCINATDSGPSEVFFRLTNAVTGKPLANVIVSVYDGFDRTEFSFFSVPTRKANNEPYRVADVKTTSDGSISLNLRKFKEDTILITCGELFKYIRHQGHLVTVIHYTREGNSLRVTAHYNYDLKTNLVTVIHFPDQNSDPPVAFSLIEVPMD